MIDSLFLHGFFLCFSGQEVSRLEHTKEKRNRKVNSSQTKQRSCKKLKKLYAYEMSKSALME